MDAIPTIKTVLFVGEYFSMMTTVVLDETLREDNEKDDDFAIRTASVLLDYYYGWDVAAVSHEIGVVDD